MTDEIQYSFLYDSVAPLVYMGEGLVEVLRDEDREDETAPGWSELRQGDVLLLSVLPGVDFLHHVVPGDKLTREAMALLESVEPPEVEEDPTVDEDDYPHDGTKDEVLAWVGDDLDRARMAMHLEVATGSPRTTLTEALQRLVASQEG